MFKGAPVDSLKILKGPIGNVAGIIPQGIAIAFGSKGLPVIDTFFFIYEFVEYSLQSLELVSKSLMIEGSFLCKE